MIRADAADLPEVEAFLAARSHLAMFPLSNLRQHGVTGFHPHRLTLWITRDNGAVSDVLALSLAGVVMPLLPSGDFAAAAAALRGQSLTGLIGAQYWVRPLQGALHLTSTPMLDRDEPHFLLQLSDLRPQPGPGELAPLSHAPEAVIKDWLALYVAETMNAPAEKIPAEVEARYQRYLKAESHMCLMDGGRPLSMSGFNARLPDMVQIGGVFTPPDLRGKGLARRGLALHLAQARDAGVVQATLFAASDAAASAYRAVGFQQVGQWTLLLLPEPEVAHG